MRNSLTPGIFRAGLLLALSSVFSTGCENAFRGAPERVMDVDAEIALLDSLIGAESLSAALASPPDKATRNAIVGARMYAVDLRFHEFETALMREGRDVGFLTALVELGVDTAGSLVGGNASQILSAVSAGITGGSESFEKEILVDQTVQALLTQMRARRAQVANRIRFGMQMDVADYPLPLALRDVGDYYQAGTLVGALVEVTQRAGIQAAEAEQAMDARVYNFSTTAGPTRDALQEFLEIDADTGQFDPDALAALLACFPEAGLDQSVLVVDFLFSENYGDQRDAVVACLRRGGEIN